MSNYFSNGTSLWLTCHPRCEAAGAQSITIPGDVLSRSADLAGWGPPQLRLASRLAGAAAGLASRFGKQGMFALREVSVVPGVPQNLLSWLVL